MAVAVKESSQTDSPGLFDRLAVSSLAGMAYVLGSIGVVFYGLPRLWEALVGETLGIFVNVALLLVVMLAAAAGLIWFGLRLVGPQPKHGLRAGIFVGAAGLLAIAFLTWLAGTVLEKWFHGPSALIGAGLAGLIGLGLLAGALRWFFQANAEKLLIAVEDQGWFSATAYKKSQGQRVRRGTILGILVLAGCGIYTLMAHRTLETAGHENWELTLPFAPGAITSAGDLDRLSEEQRLEKGWPVDRATLAARNESLKELQKIKEPGDSKFEKDQLVSRKELEEERSRLAKGSGLRPPTAGQPLAAVAEFPSITVLPHVRFTVPLLLAAGALWLAFRVVNFPVFADFLIATEAELNKVSWTTRKRLVQDTIVVLVMVVLMTAFLFAVDYLWFRLLKLPYIEVLRISDDTTEQVESDRELPW